MPEIELCYNDGFDPFARETLKIVDYGVSDDVYVVTSEVVKALHARVARLEEALKRGVELHENCDADTCMCGKSMWHPLADHKPTAMLQYYGDQWAEEARRALEEK